MNFKEIGILMNMFNNCNILEINIQVGIKKKLYILSILLRFLNLSKLKIKDNNNKIKKKNKNLMLNQLKRNFSNIRVFNLKF